MADVRKIVETKIALTTHGREVSIPGLARPLRVNEIFDELREGGVYRTSVRPVGVLPQHAREHHHFMT